MNTYKRIKSVKELGMSVRTLRKAHKLNSLDIADIAGVGNKFLSNLENGKKESLEFGKILDVLNALGIELHVKEPKASDV